MWTSCTSGWLIILFLIVLSIVSDFRWSNRGRLYWIEGKEKYSSIMLDSDNFQTIIMLTKHIKCDSPSGAKFMFATTDEFLFVVWKHGAMWQFEVIVLQALLFCTHTNSLNYLTVEFFSPATIRVRCSELQQYLSFEVKMQYAFLLCLRNM